VSRRATRHFVKREEDLKLRRKDKPLRRVELIMIQLRNITSPRNILKKKRGKKKRSPKLAASVIITLSKKNVMATDAQRDLRGLTVRKTIENGIRIKKKGHKGSKRDQYDPSKECQSGRG